MPGPREPGQCARVVDLVIPAEQQVTLAVAAPVPDRVQRVHRDAVGGQPAPERLVEAQVLAEVAVAEDDDGADVPLG